MRIFVAVCLLLCVTNGVSRKTRSARLERACVKEEVLRMVEGANAQQHSNDNDDTAESHVMAFLSSSLEVKSLSEYAVIQLSALQECKIKEFPNERCPEFWRKVHKGHCEDVKLHPYSAAGLEEMLEEAAEIHEERTGVELNEEDDMIDSCENIHCPYKIYDCPDYSPYRTLDGSCNNADNPSMGKANRAFARLLPAEYEDCVQEPKQGLPSARLVSNTLFRERPHKNKRSRYTTMMHMTFGQLLDHDIDRTAVSMFRDELTGELVNIGCGESKCETTGVENHECFPIFIPKDDSTMAGKECLQFVRSQEILRDDCEISTREQVNQITAWLDASFVYGSDDTLANRLRSHTGGFLKTSQHPFNDEDGTAYPGGFMDLMPTQHDKACRNTTEDIQCFLSGDARQNEQVGLIALHTVFLRYHNYIAENLQARHPDWDDEKVYQESRRLLTAVWQHLVYNEYLPSVVGKSITEAYKLMPGTGSERSEYKPDINADIVNSFAAAVFRFGHSEIGDTLLFSDPALKDQDAVSTSKILFNPTRIYKSSIRDNKVSGVTASVVGMSTEEADDCDSIFATQIRDSLFSNKPPFGVGADLPALNVQRGRDHGLPGYVQFRNWCSEELSRHDSLSHLVLNRSKRFKILRDAFPDDLLEHFKNLYSDVEDIDLFVGGMLEDPVPGGIVGPTFSCLIAEQFYRLKHGDRFFYEHEPQDNTPSYNQEQLNNIREQTFSNVLCKTLEDLPDDDNSALNFQKYALLQPKDYLDYHAADMDADRKAEVLKLYHEENNERKLCSQHSELNFSLF